MPSASRRDRLRLFCAVQCGGLTRFLTEEMLFRDKGQMLAIGNEAVRNTDSIVIDERTFIPVNEKFLELLVSNGNQLFAEYKCQITMPGKSSGYGGTSQTTAITSVSSIQADGLLYQLKLPDDFKIKPYTNYWIKMDGEYIRFHNMRQLRRIYKDKGTLFDGFLKEHNVKYDNHEGLVMLVQYLESIEK